jgi:ATP-dependent Clp protease adapter protein ClpS
VAWQAHREGVAATYQGPQEMAEAVCVCLQREGLTSDCAEG